MADIQTFVKNLLKKTTKTSEQWLEHVPAWLGDHDGVVLTSTWGIINVRTVEGQVLQVYNTVAPAERNIMVEIGRSKDQPNLWQVISRRSVFGNVPASSSVQYHHLQHEYPAGDSVFVRRDQFTPLLVLPAGGFNVRLYGDVVYKLGMANPIKVENQDLDLSSYAIGAGAKYVLLEALDDGTLNYIDGSVVGSLELLELEPLPTPSSNAFPICAFIFYELQTELRRDDDERTIIDLRMFTSDTSSDAGSQWHDATADTPLDADEFGFYDVVDAALKKITWANIKATLKTYFDTLYSALGHTHTLVTEDVQDIVGAMVSGNNETGIDATYDDPNGKLDFSVPATGASHVHGLARWVASSSQTTFDLPDFAEYIDAVTDNGTEVDATIYSLSSDRTQIVLDTGATAGHIIQSHYVLAVI